MNSAYAIDRLHGSEASILAVFLPLVASCVPLLLERNSIVCETCNRPCGIKARATVQY